MSKTKADDKILSYNDVVLRQSDLRILSGQHFLNDRIIEFYFSYLSSSHLSQDILLVPPAITFWIMNCPDTSSLTDFLQPLNLPSKKLIVFPVNNNDDVSTAEGGTHWSLLAFEKTAGLFVHHDSFSGGNSNHAKRLYNTLLPFIGVSGAGFLECSSSPQQENHYDCGMYVLAITKEICWWFDSGTDKNEDLWFIHVKEQVTSSTVSILRFEILELVKNLSAKK